MGLSSFVESDISKNEIKNSEIGTSSSLDISKESMDKYDKLLGDDKIDSISSVENIDKKIDNGNTVDSTKLRESNSFEINKEKYYEMLDRGEILSIEDYNVQRGLNWPPEITSNVNSLDELKIYEKANVYPEKVGDKICLVRNDINWNEKDFMGRSNVDRVKQGLSPILNGSPVELHHIGQHSYSPLAELTPQEHRSGGNDTILHNKMKESEIDRIAFSKERSDHWSKRIEAVN